MNFLTNRRLEVKEFTITRIIIAYLHCCGVGLGGDKDSGVDHDTGSLHASHPGADRNSEESTKQE